MARFNLYVQNGYPIQVRVAKGELLSSEGMPASARVHIQGTISIIDFFTLTLQDCDAVLGVKWLLSLGPILWNFVELKIDFLIKEGKCVSRAIHLLALT